MNILKDLFSPTIFHFTFSVICSSDETKCNEENLGIITLVVDEFREAGYNVRVFNPAGKDDIGGGCGQLWYVQQYLKTLKTK
jgi:23S rRNA (adenine2503-C2)-methyltransferase